MYGAGGAAGAALGVLFLPIFTRILTVAEYGQIELLLMIRGLLGAVLNMGMDAAQTFYFYEQKQGGVGAQARVVSAILQWQALFGGALVLAGLFAAPFLASTLFDGGVGAATVGVTLLGSLLGQYAHQSANVFRLRFRPVACTAVTFGGSLASMLAALALVGLLRMGSLGYMTGFALGALLSALAGWWANRAYVDGSRLHADWWPRLLKFGAPLVPGALSMYVLNSADRWFIKLYVGPEELGLYAVAAKFAGMIMLLVIAFRQAWWPIGMEALQTADGPSLYRQVSRLYLGLGMAGVVVLTALSPWLVRLLAAPAFHAGYPMAGVLAFASVFYGFSLIVTGGIWKAEKTHWAAIGMGAAALLNVGLDFLLVPCFGGIGAAVATALSFLAWNAIMLVVSERLWRIRYPIGVLCLQVALGAAAVGGILMLYGRNHATWPALGVASCAGLVLVWLSVGRNGACLISRILSGRNRCGVGVGR